MSKRERKMEGGSSGQAICMTEAQATIMLRSDIATELQKCTIIKLLAAIPPCYFPGLKMPLLADWLCSIITAIYLQINSPLDRIKYLGPWAKQNAELKQQKETLLGAN